MKTIIVPAYEFYNEELKQFVTGKETKIVIEHSLMSISKWEAIFNKPFLSSDVTGMEMLEYIKCMTVSPNISDYTYFALSQNNINEIESYINASMSARRVQALDEKANAKKKSKKRRNEIPVEAVYYWMTQLNIPFEPCEKWHLNRLLSLIEYCSEKNEEANPNKKKKKKSSKQLISEFNRINEQNAKILFNKEG